MQALRTNTQQVSLTLPLNRNARANTRQVEMCTCLALVVWWSALGEGLGVFHLGVLGGCLVWGGFAFGGVGWLLFAAIREGIGAAEPARRRASCAEVPVAGGTVQS